MYKWTYRILVGLLILVALAIFGLGCYGAGREAAGKEYAVMQRDFDNYERPTIQSLLTGPRQWDI